MNLSPVIHDGWAFLLGNDHRQRMMRAMHTSLDAVLAMILFPIQRLTEFLPTSSSAYLASIPLVSSGPDQVGSLISLTTSYVLAAISATICIHLLLKSVEKTGDELFVFYRLLPSTLLLRVVW